MELHVWPADFGLPSIDVKCLQFLVRMFFVKHTLQNVQTNLPRETGPHGSSNIAYGLDVLWDSSHSFALNSPYLGGPRLKSVCWNIMHRVSK